MKYIYLILIVLCSCVLQAQNRIKTIHVFVALCDNQYQGIVKVPPKIGNGQNAATNLYWGAGYGIKTYFSKSKNWQLVKTFKANGMVLERLVFKHKTQNYYLIADAYNGKNIKDCTIQFFNSLAGNNKQKIMVDSMEIGINGNASLVAYIGHNGLMDFELPNTFKNTDKIERSCIALACISRAYFESFIRTANALPLLLTNTLMCPEAYTLHDALEAYLKKESNNEVRNKAAIAYAKYQKCSVKAAKNILVTGWQ